ncbi:uncharacterized protein BJX67DRAFT_350626 [Aspergillus lucknowensis]|uniref:Uncharacterized protein n=1 Tax=Aspergillus lucknowensis TaxID=176173 RepID=A0ABR4LUZ5_9EURO
MTLLGRTKAKKVEFHAWPPTFNEASSQEDLSREGRGARRAARNRSASQEAWRPPSEAFSDDEGIILPKLPKRVLKKAAKR